MAACLWKTARNLYCSLSYVECSLTPPPAKTCLELWMEAVVGNVVAFRNIIAASFFIPFAFVRDSFAYLYCSLPGTECKTATFPPPIEEDNYTWLGKVEYGLEEYGIPVLLWTTALVQRILKLIIFRPVVWLYQSSIVHGLVLFIVLSLVTLKIFKVLRIKYSNRAQNGPSPRVPNIHFNLDHVTKIPKEIQPGQQ